MITVKDLHKKFGDLHVLKGVNNHIEQGEVVVVIGPSGSGKSTFLRCLNLLEEPTSGEVWIDGVQVNRPGVDINKVREEVGMV
ncbi:MAG: amino acid ABC transporter ATP-binding protein, partial [Firmicutes bacterium]|nr:amino acid ABC transporter ATP-binding protein [Bacillota bacterium]